MLHCLSLEESVKNEKWRERCQDKSLFATEPGRSETSPSFDTDRDTETSEVNEVDTSGRPKPESYKRTSFTLTANDLAVDTFSLEISRRRALTRVFSANLRAIPRARIPRHAKTLDSQERRSNWRRKWQYSQSIVSSRVCNFLVDIGSTKRDPNSFREQSEHEEAPRKGFRRPVQDQQERRRRRRLPSSKGNSVEIQRL